MQRHRVDLSLVQHFPGIIVTHNVCGNKLNIEQEGFFIRVMKRFCMRYGKPVATVMGKDKPHKTEEDEEAGDNTLYQ